MSLLPHASARGLDAWFTGFTEYSHLLKHSALWAQAAGLPEGLGPSLSGYMRQRSAHVQRRRGVAFPPDLKS